MRKIWGLLSCILVLSCCNMKREVVEHRLGTYYSESIDSYLIFINDTMYVQKEGANIDTNRYFKGEGRIHLEDYHCDNDKQLCPFKYKVFTATFYTDKEILIGEMDLGYYKYMGGKE